jgi:Ca-activated chloride channel family protein
MNELHWQNAELVWLYGAIAVLAIGVVLHFQWKSAVTRRLGDVELIRRLMRDLSPTAQWVRWIVIIAAAALMITALLRPQYGTRESQLANRGVDIVFALDMSKSMMVRDVAPNRLKAAVAELEALLAKLTGGRVALVPFAGSAFTQTPLTTDLDAVRSYLNDLRVEDMPIGGTQVGIAIRHAMRVFEPQKSEQGDPDTADLEQPAASHFKAIVLITDGENHDESALTMAKLAGEKQIRIYTVGIGSQASAAKIPVISAEGERMGWVYDKDGSPIFSELNTTLLNDLADATQGKAFVYGRDDVTAGLAAELDALEKQEYEHHYENLREDRFQFMLIPALLLLIAESLITDRRRRRRRGGALR